MQSRVLALHPSPSLSPEERGIPGTASRFAGFNAFPHACPYLDLPLRRSARLRPHAIARLGEVARLRVRRARGHHRQRLVDTGSVAPGNRTPLAAAGVSSAAFTGGEPEPSLGPPSRDLRTARNRSGPTPSSGSAAAATWTWPRSPPPSLAHGGSAARLRRRRHSPRPDPAADLRADHRRHRLRSVGRRRADRHRQPHEGRHPEQLPAAARRRGRSAADAVAVRRR